MHIFSKSCQDNLTVGVQKRGIETSMAKMVEGDSGKATLTRAVKTHFVREESVHGYFWGDE